MDHIWIEMLSMPDRCPAEFLFMVSVFLLKP